MKKLILALLAMSSLLVLSSYGDNMQSGRKKFRICTTKADAFNMMIASEMYANKLYNDQNDAREIYEKAYDLNKQRKLKSSKEDKKVESLRQNMSQKASIWAAYVQEITKLSRDINSGKYQHACDRYIEIAKKYNFDIEAASKTTITIDSLKKDGAKNGGECSAPVAGAALMFFFKDASEEGHMQDREVKALFNSAGLDGIQNPNLVCEKLKVLTKKFGFSYPSLIKRANLQVEKSKNIQSKHAKSIEENAKKNKKCSVNDAVELRYKEEDFHQKFYDLYDKWGNRISSIRDSKIYDSARKKQADIKRKEVDKVSHAFYKEFVLSVQKQAADLGKYDLACENYKKLENKYKIILQNLKQEYIDFHDKKRGQVPVDSPEESEHVSTSTRESNISLSSNDKYNAMVEAINKFSPRIYSSFKTYVKSCGADKTTRLKDIYSNVAGTKVKLPNSYMVTVYYSGYYKDHVLKILNDALASKSLPTTNSIINEYKDSMNLFMQLFTEASEYYKMKDYAEDDFKKGDKMHAPLVAAYNRFEKADRQMRQTVDHISDTMALSRIEAYKSNNDLLFYYVEKSLYFAKSYYKYASHNNDLMTVDSKELLKKMKLLRSHYNEFKLFKQKNEQLFRDNNDYSFYLDRFSDYLIASKELYLRVKSKKRYDKGEEEFLKYVPEQARSMILANKMGSLPKLLNAYNELVKYYNKLEM